MFNKNANPEEHRENPSSAETVIGPSVKVRGNFHGDGDIIIDGIVDGNIKTNSKLYVGKKAKINAGVEAKEAKIGGQVTGNIKISDFLEITSSAKIVGDITTAKMSVEKGAQINGKCSMGEKEGEHHSILHRNHKESSSK